MPSTQDEGAVADEVVLGAEQAGAERRGGDTGECYYQGLMARRTSRGGERIHAIETGCEAINERI
jgi:hypothetical protein